MSDMKTSLVRGFQPGLEPLASKVADPATGQNAVEFAKLVKQSIDGVNETQASARNLAERFELGDPNVDLVRVMVEMQKARVSFEAVSQVRNKFVEAYREIMNMQV